MRLSYSYYNHDAHADTFIRGLSKRFGFKVVSATPMPIADCWEFELELDEAQAEQLKAELRSEHMASKAHAFFCTTICLCRDELSA